MTTGTHTEHEDDPWTIDIGDHPGRTDSPTYLDARKYMIAAVKLVQPWFYGDPPYQDHHGGGIWVKLAGRWRLYKNMAGSEWSAMFAAAPAAMEELRQNAEALVAACVGTEEAYKTDLGMSDEHLAILHTPITDATTVANFVDSFWNASVPLPQGFHTGTIPSGDHEHGGVHYYPTPITDIQFFKRDDFVLWVQDSAGHSYAVAPADFGSKSVRVLHTEEIQPHLDTMSLTRATVAEGDVLDADHPLAKLAFGEK